MKCKLWIRPFQLPKFQCFSSQCALHGLCAPLKVVGLNDGIPRSHSTCTCKMQNAEESVRIQLAGFALGHRWLSTGAKKTSPWKTPK